MADPPGRRTLPAGIIPVGIGLVTSGLSAYVFLGITKRMLDDGSYAALSQLWTITFILVPGFFLPVEQEVGRAIAHRRALEQGAAPVIRRGAALCAGLLAVVLAAVGAAGGPLRERVFGGSMSMYLALLIGVAGFTSTHLTRGVLAGNSRFGRFGAVQIVDGAARVALCAAFAAAGVTSPLAYGLLVGLPPLGASLAALRGARRLGGAGPPTAWSEITPKLGWLLAGSLLSALLINAGIVAAKVLASDGQTAEVNDFFAASLLLRVPLLLFQAVQAVFLPRLAGLAARRDALQFRRMVRNLLAVVLALSLTGLAGSAVAGPAVLQIGFEAEVSVRTMVNLAVSTGLYIAALALSQAIIALDGHRHVAIGWLLGALAFAATLPAAGRLLDSGQLLLRVEAALIAASLTSFAYFAAHGARGISALRREATAL
jgi:O-antigen/teichoic acid export membrane protein